MLDVVLRGLVTGWAIAVPIGAVGAFLVTLSARSPWRVGAAAALGIATVDGAYALVAVVAGAALAKLLEPVAAGLAVASGVVLLVIAGLTAAASLRAGGGTAADSRILTPQAAFLLFVAITAVNPTTVVYFAAVVIGNPDLTSTSAEAAVFVAAAFVASASWQLTLAAGGASLGRVVTGPRGRVVTGLVSAGVIGGLAIHTMLR